MTCNYISWQRDTFLYFVFDLILIYSEFNIAIGSISSSSSSISIRVCVGSVNGILS